MKRIFLISIAFFALSIIAKAQDYMTLRNGDEKEVKIIEIGTDEIKYKSWPEVVTDPVLSIEKSKVAKVLLANGQLYEFAADQLAPMDVESQKKNAIKLAFLSPLLGTTYIGFEHSIKPGQSIEFELGIIGLGVNVAELSQRGVAFKAGYKFIKSPDYYLKGMKASHILNGAYVKPELVISTYSYNNNSDYYDINGNYVNSSVRENTVGGAAVINLGKQWVYSNAFLIDLYSGVGFGFSSGANASAFGFYGGWSQFPIAFTAGFRIGLLVK